MTMMKNFQQEHLALLGATLLSAQKLELDLFTRISKLTKEHATEQQKQLIEISTPETFLQAKGEELNLTLSVYEQVFGDKLPLSKQSLLDFIYRRNLITKQYWHVTGADVKGGEKLGNPDNFLQDFYHQCETWQKELTAA